MNVYCVNKELMEFEKKFPINSSLIIYNCDTDSIIGNTEDRVDSLTKRLFNDGFYYHLDVEKTYPAIYLGSFWLEPQMWIKFYFIEKNKILNFYLEDIHLMDMELI